MKGVDNSHLQGIMVSLIRVSLTGLIYVDIPRGVT